MRKDIKINVDTQTDGISLSSRRLGISSENLQGKIIFTPKPFIDGICRMYIEGHGTIEMDKQEDCYTLDIKSSLLITPSIDVCFKITEPEKDNGVPIYATKIMHFEVLDTIESNEPIPEQYPQWTEKIDEYVETKKTELDTYTTDKKTELDTYKTDLEKEISTTKDTLVNDFNSNAETKTNAFNDNATEKTTNYNTNAETKIKEYNTNATNKVNEFNENVDSLENELTELASQMPWNTTEIQDSIHIEDSAKYSRNKLELFGNLEQEKREGYNLFNVDTITKNNYILNTNGVLGASEVTHTSDYIAVTAGKTYLVTFKYTALANEGQRAYCYFDTEKQYLKGSQYTPSNKQILIKPTDDGFIRFSYDINCTEIQCIEGTTAKDYEPYGAMPSIEYPSMPVVATGVQKISKLGKNLFDKNNVNILQGQHFDNDGRIMGSTGARTLYVNCLANHTYTISKITSARFKVMYTTEVPANTVQGKGVIINHTATNITITTGEDAKYLCVYYYYSSADTLTEQEVLDSIQIEIGDTATDYEPYKEEIINLYLGNTELCKITDKNGNVVAQDRAVYREVDGVWKWQWEKNIYKIVFTGNESWLSTTAYEGFYRFRFDVNNESLLQDTAISVLGLNSHFTQRIYQSHGGYEYLYVQTTKTGGSIYIQLKDIKTVEDLKALLIEQYNNGIPITVYYVGLKSSYEDCTVEQSEVLDKLYKLSLQKGTNNIYVESENGVTTELQLTYMQDLMSQINELKQAMINIGGN